MKIKIAVSNENFNEVKNFLEESYNNLDEIRRQTTDSLSLFIDNTETRGYNLSNLIIGRRENVQI
ncbi:MAG: hypothetical protein IJ192_00240 [Clostridia bacterium]|nr:hypothetical protein [Clostridia bacterium]MBR2176364.1 hypothetical protein [Clostridia bacterium]